MAMMARAVPEHSPAECRAVLKYLWTRVRKLAVPEEDLRGWVLQATNGATNSTRACSRTELCVVVELLKYRLGERPFRRRRPRANAEHRTSNVEHRTAGPAPPHASRLTPHEAPRAAREARKAAGVAELPSVWQLQKLFGVAEDLRLTDQELAGIAARALGLTALQRQHRTEGPVELLSRRHKVRDRVWGFRQPRVWRTKADAGKVIDALVAIRLRRLREAAIVRGTE
jgi:hypothetical protein